mgnify:CR=1 FL=1
MHQPLSARSALGSTVLLVALTAAGTAPALASPSPVAPSPTPASVMGSSAVTGIPPASGSPSPSAPAPAAPSAPPAASPALPALPDLTPADAALQPTPAARVAPVTIVLPGTGERRAVLALPYTLDRDHDGVRESTALVMEADLPVPTGANVTLGVEQEWSSDSSARAVPDPAAWDRIAPRVAGIARAVADQRSRSMLAQRAGLGSLGSPADVDRLVLQAAQLAVWGLSCGVTLAADQPYAADARQTALLRAMTDRLVDDASLTTPGEVDVYRVQSPDAAPSGAVLHVTGGRGLVAAAATSATPALVVARASGSAPLPRTRPAAPLAPAATVATSAKAPPAKAPAAKAPAAKAAPSAQAPAASAPDLRRAARSPVSPARAATPGALRLPTVSRPAADTSSCTALGRTDVSRLDSDYRAALDRDNDGIACESNGADGAVNLGGNRVNAAPQTTNQATVTPGATTASTTTTGGQSCDALRASGRSSIPSGDPLYRADLDRDGDGIACESYEGPRGSGTLAQTGFEAPQLSALAFGTIGVGALLVRLGRRRAHG